MGLFKNYVKPGHNRSPEDPAVTGENAGLPPAAHAAGGMDTPLCVSKLLRGSVHVPAFNESAG